MLRYLIPSLENTGGFPSGSDGKELVCNAGDLGLIPALGRFPWRRERLPTPVSLPGESHGQRSLAGHSPRGCKESGRTEWYHFHLASQVAPVVKKPPASAGDTDSIAGSGRSPSVNRKMWNIISLYLQHRPHSWKQDSPIQLFLWPFH